MMTFLNEKINDNSDEVKLEFVGESQKGKKIPILFFNRDNNNNNKVKVFFKQVFMEMNQQVQRVFYI